MDIQDYVKKYNLSFNKVKSEFDIEFNSLFESDKEWHGNLEDKVQLLKNDKDQDQITDVINKLKSTESFKENDFKILSTFVSKVNTIVRIANRINNFKEGTLLDNGAPLRLYDFFNSVKASDNLSEFNYPLNSNLNNFLPHIYSLIKHCQNPIEYPIYYKYWKNILREVLSKNDDYDSMCSYYRSFPSTKRHQNFATYLGVLGIQIAKNINSSGIEITAGSKDYKYLTNEVINIERYNSILDNQLTNSVNSSTQNIQYWLYSPGENARNWEEFYNDGILALGWDVIGDLTKYTSRDQIKKALVEAYGGQGSKKNDVSANDDFLNKINIGDIVIAKKGRGELLGYGVVISDYTFDKNRDEFQHIRKVNWKLKGNWKVDFSLVLKTLTDITKYSSDHPEYDTYYEKLLGIMGSGQLQKDNRKTFTIWLNEKYGENSGTTSSYIKAIDILSQILSKELFRTSDDSYLDSLYNDLIKEQRNQDGKYYHSDAPSYGSKGFYSASIKSYKEFLKTSLAPQTLNLNQMEFPLNTILYGPPGTGKTYNTILRAAEIVENRPIDSYDEALEIFQANLHNQIEFITFHQNYSYEDFIQGLRPETDNKSSLVFDKIDGVFKKIADKALENLKLAQKAPEELSNEVKFDKALESFSDRVLESEVNFKINDTAYIFEVEEEAFRYTGEKWANHTNGLRMKFSDLKEFYRSNVRSRKDVKNLSNISGLANQHATYYFLVYTEILKHLPEKAEEPHKINRKNFVLIIDEINRANISRVFGELITLIEPDKRSHGSIPLEARLPSGDPFIVPSNLYIIGTMNTADKSIALLDIALRRRFEFESMYPKYEIEGQKIYDVEIFKKINEQIIKSKGHDFQIGQAYFMGENTNLVLRMNKKVIPLLLEYYMNDEKEVKGILQSAGLTIEENSWPLRIQLPND